MVFICDGVLSPLCGYNSGNDTFNMYPFGNAKDAWLKVESPWMLVCVIRYLLAGTMGHYSIRTACTYENWLHYNYSKHVALHIEAVHIKYS
jgi:hypothetical protein